MSATDLFTVRDGVWLDAQDFSSVPEARELLDEGRCSPQCLLAREPGSECTCRCGGDFHGTLATTLVPVAQRAPWYARHCGWHPSLLDDLVPAVGSVREFNRLYGAAKRAHVPFAAVWHRGKTWEMHFDPRDRGV